MFNRSLKSLFTLLLTLSWSFLIIYISGLNLKNSGLFTDISKFLNGLFIQINLDYRFRPTDISNLLRFLEYFFLGTMSYLCCRTFFKDFSKNIFIFLFFGLSLSIAEMYYCFSTNVRYDIWNLIISFVEFAVGFLIFGMMFRNVGNEKTHKNRYKKSKYSVGRKN